MRKEQCSPPSSLAYSQLDGVPGCYQIPGHGWALPTMHDVPTSDGNHRPLHGIYPPATHAPRSEQPGANSAMTEYQMSGCYLDSQPDVGLIPFNPHHLMTGGPVAYDPGPCIFSPSSMPSQTNSQLDSGRKNDKFGGCLVAASQVLNVSDGMAIATKISKTRDLFTCQLWQIERHEHSTTGTDNSTKWPGNISEVVQNISDVVQKAKGTLTQSTNSAGGKRIACHLWQIRLPEDATIEADGFHENLRAVSEILATAEGRVVTPLFLDTAESITFQLWQVNPREDAPMVLGQLNQCLAEMSTIAWTANEGEVEHKLSRKGEHITFQLWRTKLPKDGGIVTDDLFWSQFALLRGS